MRTFTKEEIELLSQAEEHFYTVVKGGFKRATSSKMDKLVAETYNAAVPEKPVSSNAGCGICSFNLYKKVAEKYYQDKEIVQKELEPKDITTTKSVSNVVSNNKVVANKNTNGKGKSKKGRKASTK